MKLGKKSEALQKIPKEIEKTRRKLNKLEVHESNTTCSLKLRGSVGMNSDKK